MDKRSRALPPQAPPAYSSMGAPYGLSLVGPPTPNTHSGEPKKQDNGNSIEFYIPKDQAGAVIGKGGQGLRDIRQETVSECSVEIMRIL